MGLKTAFEGRGHLCVCAAAFAAALLILPAKAARAQSSSSSSTPSQTQSQAAAPAQPASTPSAMPNLAGTWKLNEKESDDPREKMREAMGGNGPGGDSGGALQGRQGRRSGRGGGGGMMAQFSQLTIDQTDKSVNVTNASGRVIATTEPPKKEDQNDQDNSGGMRRFPPATAKWQGAQLVATSEGFGGGTTTRTFELSPDGKQLYVTTKIENERFSQPVTYRLVFDPGKAENNSSQ
jgi:hypothetical protein